jgi:hypothetical protein
VHRWPIIGICCLVACSALLLVLASRTSRPRGVTRLELTDAENGRKIFADALPDGEEIVLTWKNSLFNLTVTEIFAVHAGALILRSVTFADPRGLPPPLARPDDLDDLYHTGGPFHVEGLHRPLTHAVFRIGEIGDPRVTFGHHALHLKQEVGFGGSVRLEVRKPHPRWNRSVAEGVAYIRNAMAAASF